VPDNASCQLLQDTARRRDCAPNWLVEAEPGLIHARRVACRDGDAACDRDDVLGQCTIHLSVCTPPSAGCPRASLHTLQPSRRKARRSSVAAAVRNAMEAALTIPPAPGECSAAAALVVPAAEHLTVRVGAPQRSRAIKLLCEAVPAAE
jgi:hypothetical protein